MQSLPLSFQGFSLLISCSHFCRVLLISRRLGGFFADLEMAIKCGTLSFQPLGVGTNKWGTDPQKWLALLWRSLRVFGVERGIIGMWPASSFPKEDFKTLLVGDLGISIGVQEVWFEDNFSQTVPSKSFLICPNDAQDDWFNVSWGTTITTSDRPLKRRLPQARFGALNKDQGRYLSTR